MFSKFKDRISAIRRDAILFNLRKSSYKHELTKSERDEFFVLLNIAAKGDGSIFFVIMNIFIFLGVLSVVFYIFNLAPNYGQQRLVLVILVLIVCPIILILIERKLAGFKAKTLVNKDVYILEINKKYTTHINTSSYFITTTIAPTFYIGISVKFYRRVKPGDSVLVYAVGKRFFAVPWA
ncbi:MAG: hypothetical protein FWG70_11370 [Oscillospiraceae bacterium]|nr:hypothetical protein [Oscillospiraceae bacterium]